MMKNAYCRLCDGGLSIYGEHKVLGRHDIKYYTCNQCGSLQTEEPYWLDEAYDPELPNFDVGACERNIQLVLLCDALFAVMKLKSNHSFLDYGSGNGIYARMMRDRGFNFRCYDKYIKARYAYGYTEDSMDNNSASIITAFEVFEHLPEPKKELGLLFNREPDALFFTTELYTGQGIDWDYLAPAEGQHVFFYSVKAMQMLAGTDYEFMEFGLMKAFLAKTFIKDLEDLDVDIRSISINIKANPTEWNNLCLRVFAQHASNPWQYIQADHRQVIMLVKKLMEMDNAQ